LHPLIEDNRDAIEVLCREFGIARLEVFGSIVNGEFDPERSDVDFIVEYPEGYDLGPWAGKHLELQERLEAVLGRKVDLIMAGAIRKPRFIQSISSSRKVLYAA
jgi:predicted nucleotidyltransferase